MVFSFIGFRYPTMNVTAFALVGALAATSGRLLLAKFSRVIVRRHFLSESSKQNVDAIKTGLQGRRKFTFGLFLFYAFSPLPSNYLFIAYGLTNMDLNLVGIPFFVGRSVSYAFWAHSSAAASRWLDIESGDIWSYMSLYFLATQTLILFLLYMFTRIDWQRIFKHRELRLLSDSDSLKGNDRE